MIFNINLKAMQAASRSKSKTFNHSSFSLIPLESISNTLTPGNKLASSMPSMEYPAPEIITYRNSPVARLAFASRAMQSFR